MNRLRQHPASEPLHVQILNSDYAVLVHQLPRQFVVEIGSLVPNVNVSPLKQQYSLTAAGAALPATGDLALTATEPGLRVPVVPGVLDLGPIGHHCETGEPHVNSGGAVAGRQRLGIALDTEAGEPAARFALDRNRLDLAFDGTVQVDLDFTSALNPKFGCGQLAAISVGRERDAVIAPERPKSREPDLLLATLAPGKEGSERLVDSSQYVLAAREVGKGEASVRPHRLQLVGLIVVVDRLAANFPGSDAFFQSGVIEAGGFLQFASKEHHLSLRQQKLVLEGQTHLLPLSPETLVFTTVLSTLDVPVQAGGASHRKSFPLSPKERQSPRLYILGDDNATKQDLLDLEERLTTKMAAMVERSETNLLSVFHGWARATEIKIKSVSNTTAPVDERMSLLEERVLNLERRRNQ